MKQRVILKLIVIFGFMVAFLFVFRGYTGYWPLPLIVRKFYYINMSEKKDLNKFMLDDSFKCGIEGYTIKSVITSPYPLEHNVVLIIQDTRPPLPPNYVFKGEISVTVIKDEKIIYRSTKSVSSINEYRWDGQPVCTYAFCVETMPFPLNGKFYRNATIKVIVEQPDIWLSVHVKNMQLYLVPDLSL